MKALTEVKTVKNSTNCGGTDEIFQEREFEFEDSDVGRTLDHYLGFNHASLMIRKAHVGQKIRIVSQNNEYRSYSCWYFIG